MFVDSVFYEASLVIVRLCQSVAIVEILMDCWLLITQKSSQSTGSRIIAKWILIVVNSRFMVICASSLQICYQKRIQLLTVHRDFQSFLYNYCDFVATVLNGCKAIVNFLCLLIRQRFFGSVS